MARTHSPHESAGSAEHSRADLGSRSARLKAKRSLRRRALTGNASPVAIAALDFIDVGWKEDQREVRWRQAVADLAAFRTRHGHLPRRHATDPVEKSLYNWLANRRGEHRGRGNGSVKFARENRAAYLDEHLPGWLDSTHSSRWEDVVQRISDFTAEHSRSPKVNSDDEDEAFLARWLVRQRRRLAAGQELPPGQAAALDKAIPHWNAPGLADLLHRAHQVAAFIGEHHRWPSERLTSSAHEVTLRRWLLATRRVADTAAADSVWFTQRRREHLDRVIPGWRGQGA